MHKYEKWPMARKADTPKQAPATPEWTTYSRTRDGRTTVTEGGKTYTCGQYIRMILASEKETRNGA